MTIDFDQKGKIFTDIIRKDPVPAIIQTQTERIHGNVHVRQGKRLKDTLNNPEQFIAVTDARVMGKDGMPTHRSDFLALNKDQIVWVIPDEDHTSPEVLSESPE
jgi:hypothetical protein